MKAEIGLKLKAMPMEERIEFMTNIDKMVELLHKKIELMGELKTCMMRGWEMGVTMGDEVEVTDGAFIRLVNRYYDAVETGKSQFEWEGRDVLTSYAKYLIEYLEPHVGNMQVYQNRCMEHLRKRRRQHAAWLKDHGGVP